MSTFYYCQIVFVIALTKSPTARYWILGYMSKLFNIFATQK